MLLLVGMNHTTAPVELREQFSLVGCGVHMLLDELQITMDDEAGTSWLHEIVSLSTCNRLEIYAAVDSATSPHAGHALIEQTLARLQNVPLAELQPHLYRRTERDAVQHLMTVAAGLDSMILGEPQILGQVNRAFYEARNAGATGPLLSQLFAAATHAGKRVRTETEISRHTTSVSHAAAQLARQQVGDLATSRALVVGAGEMAKLAVQALQREGATDVRLINRTYAAAERLAAEFNETSETIFARAVGWQTLGQALIESDVVLAATGAPHTVIHAHEIAPVLANRAAQQRAPLHLIDIAVPRDIEAAVDDLAGVVRYDIDDLQAAVDANLAQRQSAVPAARVIVDEETDAFLRWLQSREVVPTIVDLRQAVQEIVGGEVDHALHKLEGLTPRQQQVIERMAHRITNKLLHAPTVRLKQHTSHADAPLYTHALRDLFALDGAPASGVATNGASANGLIANGLE